MTTPETPIYANRAVLAADNWRYGIIALIAFLTLVDLFATQAILPTLASRYGVNPSTMGVAVNASTFGMAVAGLAVAIFGRNIDRRNGIWASLALLAIPTTLLAFTQDIAIFAALRVAQGMCMATAFTLTMAYLAEHYDAGKATVALSAYVTGNVASNVFGRMMSAAAADHFGVSTNFLFFAALNLAGAALVFIALMKSERMMAEQGAVALLREGMGRVLANDELIRSFFVGFCILFVFIGTYTYVNFRLTGDGIGLSAMALGTVYLIFLPSLATTPFAGRVALLLGPGRGIAATLMLAVLGLLLCVPVNLSSVLAGLAIVSIGTFLAQAIATGHVGRIAGRDRAAASGIYLSSYYAGGAVGSYVTGLVFDGKGWTASVFLLCAVLVAGGVAGIGLGVPRGETS